jgi:hypothetical protein
MTATATARPFLLHEDEGDTFLAPRWFGDGHGARHDARWLEPHGASQVAENAAPAAERPG